MEVRGASEAAAAADDDDDSAGAEVEDEAVVADGASCADAVVLSRETCKAGRRLDAALSSDMVWGNRLMATCKQIYHISRIGNYVASELGSDPCWHHKMLK